MIIDLTHSLKNKISVYPGAAQPVFAQAHTVEQDGYAEKMMTMSSHTGTHMDAPAHILAGAKTLDEFAMDKFVGPAVAIDCVGIKEIDLTLLKRYEQTISEVDFVLFYAGWQQKWNTESYLDEFPTLTIEAVEWLANFDLKALGFDVISVDKIGSETLPNHVILLEKEICIIENMNNLDQLISKRFELNCIPLKIAQADGSPVRAFARNVA